MDVLISATTLLISTSVLLISVTALLLSSSILLISATALLLSTSVLLISVTALLLRGQTRPDRCLGTPTGVTTPQYCIVPSGTYCAASYSFLMIGLVVKQLYDKTLNKE